MANDRWSSLSLFCMVFIPALIYECNGAQCMDGATCHWFMNNKYLCHCEGSVACDTTSGHCPGGRCDMKWFGPACQYSSLSYTINGDLSSAIWLTDREDTTCNDGKVKKLKLFLDTHQPLTWIRLVVRSTETIMSLQFQTRCYMPNGTETMCRIIESARVDNDTLDIQCPSSHTVDYLILSGFGVANLCSVYISGGRNLALKQTETSQSSTCYGAKAKKAVDGKIPQTNSVHEVIVTACTHTDNSDSSRTRWWTLTFSRLVKVVRVDIYNRWDPGNGFISAPRLIGFTFNAFDESNNQIFNWTDVNNTAQKIYTIVPSPRLTIPVERISVIHSEVTSPNILTICEAVVYGEYECPGGRYGLECEHTCNCAGQESCFVSTGGCPSGCAVGYTGEDCQAQCNNGTYGKNCPSICSLRCANSKCSKTYGHCTNGCKEGWTGDYCDKECKDGTYGINCSSICSSQCANSTCNKTDGHCTMGCKEGWTGDFCDTKAECEDGTYGINCSSICSLHCANSACNKTDGHCTIGCKEDWTGDFCDIKAECEDGTYGINCSSICSSHCANSACNKTDGHCTFGCKKGRTGDYCNIEPVKNEEKGEDNSNTAVFIFFLLLILLLVLTLFMQKTPKKGKNNADEDDNIDAHKSDGGYEKDEDADVSHDKDKELAYDISHDKDKELAYDEDNELVHDGDRELDLTLDQVEVADH